SSLPSKQTLKFAPRSSLCFWFSSARLQARRRAGRITILLRMIRSPFPHIAASISGLATIQVLLGTHVSRPDYAQVRPPCSGTRSRRLNPQPVDRLNAAKSRDFGQQKRGITSGTIRGNGSDCLG